MAKKVNLYPQQKAEIKRMYLQLNDKELAALIGSDVKTVKGFMKSKKLVRDSFTVAKLAKRIEVVEPETVAGQNKGANELD